MNPSLYLMDILGVKEPLLYTTDHRPGTSQVFFCKFPRNKGATNTMKILSTPIEVLAWFENGTRE